MKSIAIYYKLREDSSLSELYDESKHNDSDKSNQEDGSQLSKNDQWLSYPNVGEVHINIWKVYEGRVCLSPVYYLDLGLRVSFKCDSVMLFLPFLIQESENYDLCKVMMEHADLLCAVFNDEMLPKPQKNTCYCEVNNQTASNKFYLYQLNYDNLTFENYENGNKKEGMFLTVKFEGIPDYDSPSADYANNQLYIRLRFRILNNDDFCISERISNDLIQAAFTRTSLFDLRFNEMREIDGKVIEKMNKDGYRPLLFNKLHVFYIVDTREKVENGSALKIDSRLLEKDHWKPYEPESTLHNSHFVAHHWRKRCKKDEKPFRDFSVFFSTVYPDIRFWKLVTYLLVVVLLGWTGSMLTFNMSEIPDSDWNIELLFKPICIAGILLFVLCYILVDNFGIKWPELFRKR